jgi:prepilin-type N-terminal cleavage/methylation domain-containing protein
MGETKKNRAGFTLIELSIALVIIGLIVGGVLVGQDLIRAAGVRATITQIEKFNSAANAFREKYGYLPGDIKDPDASNFGFAARGVYTGEGDGNGILEGVSCNTGVSCDGGHAQSAGENPMFWVDLTKAGLIDGNFSAASPTTGPGFSVTASTNPSLSAFFPLSKLGNGNYFYTWSGGFSFGGAGVGTNFFGMSAAYQLQGDIYSTPGITPAIASQMDQKIDDGLPQHGNVIAEYETVGGIFWAAGGGANGASGTAATPGSTTTCYDNGNTAGATQHSSVEISNGSNITCALSFKMQAGD